MATKDEMEKKLNELTKLDIKWGRLNKGDLEKLHGIFSDRAQLLQLARAVVGGKLGERRGKLRERVKDELVTRGAGLLDDFLKE